MAENEQLAPNMITREHFRSLPNKELEDIMETCLSGVERRVKISLAMAVGTIALPFIWYGVGETAKSLGYDEAANAIQNAKLVLSSTVAMAFLLAGHVMYGFTGKRKIEETAYCFAEEVLNVRREAAKMPPEYLRANPPIQ